MAYALGLPKELTSLVYDMVDMDYETRGWRTEAQQRYKKRRVFDMTGKVSTFGFWFDADHRSAQETGFKPHRISAHSFPEFEAVFDYDEDDAGVVDVDSGQWHYHAPCAGQSPEISIVDPARWARSRRVVRFDRPRFHASRAYELDRRKIS